MSFATDVLVTALDDRGRMQANGGMNIALAGSLLIEDLLAGRSLRDLTGLDGDPSDAVGSRARGVVSIVRSQAVAEGRVRLDDHRLLGVIPRRRYLLVDTASRDALVEMMSAALTPGAQPDRFAAAFAVVCAVSGIARRWLPTPGTAEDRAALARQINDLCAIAGESVTTVIRAMRTQYRRTAATSDGSVPVVLLATDGSEDYGDTGHAGGGDGGSGSDGGGDGGGGGGGGGGD